MLLRTPSRSAVFLRAFATPSVSSALNPWFQYLGSDDPFQRIRTSGIGRMNLPPASR